MKQFTPTRLFAVTSVVAAMLAAGCSEENNEPSGNASNAAIVTASIGKTDNVVSSRAANTVWDVDDCIGISTSSVNGKTNYVNIRYKTNGSVFSPVPGAAGEDNTIYFQDKSPRPSPLTTPTRARTAPSPAATASSRKTSPSPTRARRTCPPSTTSGRSRQPKAATRRSISGFHTA